jgi:replicative DNA helicase
MELREPPWSKEAEMAVLGAVFIAPRVLGEAMGDLRPDDFFLPAHREILSAMRAVEAPDVVSVADELKVRGMLPRLENGEGYLFALANAVPTAENVGHYAAIVKERSLARRLIASCLEVTSRAHSGTEIVDLIGEHRTQLAGLELDGKAGGPVKLSDAMDGVLDAIESRARSPEKYAIGTGLDGFDAGIGGMRAGQLVIVAGLPGQGKTSFAEGVALHNGDLGVPVLIFSLEMKLHELVERALSAKSGIDGRRIVAATGLDYDTWKTGIHPAASKLRKSTVWVDDRKLSTNRICAEAVRWREKTRRERVKSGSTDDRALIVIDYLGLVRSDQRSENRNLEVAGMSASFKRLAGDLDCPVMLLSQLNRLPAREKRKPVPSDLRDSGAVEADADMIIFPWRPEPSEEDVRNPPFEIDATIIVAKHRNGPIGEVDAVFRPSTTQFLDRKGY